MGEVADLVDSQETDFEDGVIGDDVGKGVADVGAEINFVVFVGDEVDKAFDHGFTNLWFIV